MLHLFDLSTHCNMMHGTYSVKLVEDVIKSVRASFTEILVRILPDTGLSGV